MVADIPKKLNVSERYWRYLLKAQRDASPKLALRIEKKLGIPRDVFIFGSAKKRQAAWDAYINRSTL